jgi:peroxiredoxin
MSVLVFAAVAPWMLIAVGAWLGYQIVLQNGRILVRLESIEKLLAPRAAAPRKKAAGLPRGADAPDFDLPDLAGVRRKLSDFRGMELLLIFFNPKCAFCTKMAADLAALPAEGGDERPVPVVVTTGDAGENQKLVEQFGIRCLVLLQKEMDVASQYRAQGTPMGYRIDGEGRIASELTVGAEPLLKLAAPISAHRNGSPALANGSAKEQKKGDPSLARSRLQRGGLKAGTLAPEFRLPRIDGGELSLTDLKGRRVLLVFSDPDCGPCEELAPRLQEIHLQRPDLQVLVVSRRDAEANRAKAELLGLTFPIVLQRQWEVSLKYAMFATPIAYLIDEQGIIVRDVAVGVEPILSLAGESAAATFDTAEPVLAGKETAWAT